MLPLPTSDFVQVSVSVAQRAIAAAGFNQGLMIGTTPVIGSYGPGARLRQYTSLNEMLADGFTDTEPEYIAAELYLSQDSSPTSFWIGRQDLTAVQTAVPDGRTVNDAAMSSSVNPTYLDSATAVFSVGDVGLAVRVVGAGAAGADLVTTVASYTSPTEVVLTDAASTTVTGAQASIGSVGNDYAPEDKVTLTSGGTNAILTVLTVGQSGVVLTLGTTVGNQGTGFTVSNGITTSTTGSGTGLLVNVTAVGETALQAVEACALLNNNQQWYGVMVCEATDDDHIAIGAYSSANWETLLYLGSTSTVAVVNGTPGNVALTMQAVLDKAFLIYSTTQGGAFPNNIYAAAAVLGLFCGLNTGLAGSAFTLNLKQLVGIAAEQLTQNQYDTLNNQFVNSCADFGPYNNQLSRSYLSSGDWFDQILFRAMLVNQIQVNLMNLLTEVPKVPQTNQGEHQLIAQVDAACANMVSIGYIAPGVWQGPPILALATGDTMPAGFLNQAQPYAQQSAGDRAARKAMPIYCTILEAGAVQSVAVQVNVEL